MPPLRINVTEGGKSYDPITLGLDDFRQAHHVDVSELSDAHVDKKGYLIPGAVLRLDAGTNLLVPISAGSQTAFGVALYPVRVADDNETETLEYTEPVDATVLRIGLIDRALAEGNLGRAYSANELAALAAGGFKLTSPETD